MPNVFPNLSLPGYGFSVKKAPQFKTRTQRAVSGRELRLTFQPVPTWLFTLRFEFLRDKWDLRQTNDFGPPGWGTSADDLRTLMGFFMSVQGSLSPFYLTDPTDDQILGQYIGTGDGSTTAFQLVRTMGIAPAAYNEPIIAPQAVDAIYFDGVVQSSGGYTTSAPGGIVTFTSAPGNGVVITADIRYYFLCRMGDDTQDFEYFLYQLWSAEGLKLQSVLL